MNFETINQAILCLIIATGGGALAVTAIGSLMSLWFGKRENGWSNLVATILLLVFTGFTLYTMYKIETHFGEMVAFNTLFTVLEGWYLFLFFFGQPWLVRYLKRNPF